MPRSSKGPRLYLKRGERDRMPMWIIRDGPERIRTGCGEHDLEQAQRALARYINGKFEAPTGLGQRLLVTEAVAAYLKGHAEDSPSRIFLFGTSRPILEWWSGKRLSDVTAANCKGYVKWRTAQTYRGRNISDQSARHDLKTLRAALNWFKENCDPALVVPTVKLPSLAPPRTDYWLTRKQVADRIRLARKSKRLHHVARMLLIGAYTGTRPGAIFALRWQPSPAYGWFDLDNGVMYRRGTRSRLSNKRQPPVRIPARLLPHLRRWHRLDTERKVPIETVIHYQGVPVEKLRRSWDTVARLAAGKHVKDGPHILRHTAATWLMQRGVDAFEAAGFLGMTIKTLWDVYGHHHPDYQRNAATATHKRYR